MFFEQLKRLNWQLLKLHYLDIKPGFLEFISWIQYATVCTSSLNLFQESTLNTDNVSNILQENTTAQPFNKKSLV